MPLTFAVFIYVVTWCTSLFMVVPFYVQDETAGEGYAAAPRRLRWKQALMANSLVSLVITGLVVWLIVSGFVPVRNLV